mgnify:CR=1 FL=1
MSKTLPTQRCTPCRATRSTYPNAGRQLLCHGMVVEMRYAYRSNSYHALECLNKCMREPLTENEPKRSWTWSKNSNGLLNKSSMK